MSSSLWWKVHRQRPLWTSSGPPADVCGVQADDLAVQEALVAQMAQRYSYARSTSSRKSALPRATVDRDTPGSQHPRARGPVSETCSLLLRRDAHVWLSRRWEVPSRWNGHRQCGTPPGRIRPGGVEVSGADEHTPGACRRPSRSCCGLLLHRPRASVPCVHPVSKPGAVIERDPRLTGQVEACGRCSTRARWSL